MVLDSIVSVLSFGVKVYKHVKKKLKRTDKTIVLFDRRLQRLSVLLENKELLGCGDPAVALARRHLKEDVMAAVNLFLEASKVGEKGAFKRYFADLKESAPVMERLQRSIDDLTLAVVVQNYERLVHIGRKGAVAASADAATAEAVQQRVDRALVYAHDEMLDRVLKNVTGMLELAKEPANSQLSVAADFMRRTMVLAKTTSGGGAKSGGAMGLGEIERELKKGRTLEVVVVGETQRHGSFSLNNDLAVVPPENGAKLTLVPCASLRGRPYFHILTGRKKFADQTPYDEPIAPAKRTMNEKTASLFQLGSGPDGTAVTISRRYKTSRKTVYIQALVRRDLTRKVECASAWMSSEVVAFTVYRAGTHQKIVGREVEAAKTVDAYAQFKANPAGVDLAQLYGHIKPRVTYSVVSTLIDAATDLGESGAKAYKAITGGGDDDDEKGDE